MLLQVGSNHSAPVLKSNPDIVMYISFFMIHTAATQGSDLISSLNWPRSFMWKSWRIPYPPTGVMFIATTTKNTEENRIMSPVVGGLLCVGS